MKLLLATNNAHKAAELRAVLSPYCSEMCTLSEAGIDLDVVEDGASFAENAMKKAVETLAVARDFDAVLADDSGLCVDALNGAPGIYSARFAGGAHQDADNNAKLMACMADIPDAQRAAHFVCYIVLLRRNLPPICAEGICEGSIMRAPRGSNGFGYDPYFWYPPLQKGFAELTDTEKNSVSHRARALHALAEKLGWEAKRTN